MCINRKNQDGYIVVETVGVFIPFVLFVVSILSLVNIITLQARMHYALTQTAGTLSMYCYVLRAAGADDEISAMEGRAESFNESITNVIEGINALSGTSFDNDDVTGLFGTVEEIMGDPLDFIKDFVNYGISGLRNDVTSVLVTPLVYRYLAGNSIFSFEYMMRSRVVKFEITDCVIIDSGGNINITAEYEVLYTFGALRLPFTPTLRISQSVATKAWLGGSGEGYKHPADDRS